jgi:uncharacterized protein (DUF4415 family)
MKKINGEFETSARAREHGLRRIKRRHTTKPGQVSLKDAKVRVTMYLDADILEYFKKRASDAHAARYQTQINNELRAVMERSDAAKQFTDLIDNDRFIESVAAKIREKDAELLVGKRAQAPPTAAGNFKVTVFPPQSSAKDDKLDLWREEKSNTPSSRTPGVNTKTPKREAA